MKCFNIFNRNRLIKMPNLVITSKNLKNTLNYKLIFLFAILIIYFAWMDIALFVNLQRWTPFYNDQALSRASFFQNHKSSSITNTNVENNKAVVESSAGEIGVFNPLSVKLIMIDQMTHYVHDTLARFIESKLYFTYFFPWVTPNFVSYAGLALALAASKMILSDKLSYRRIGCLLFELRNFADSLDGVVYRSLAKRDHTYESVPGTFGYNVDIICDGLGGLVFVLAIFIRFLRNPPHKSVTLTSIYSCNNSEASTAANSNKNYEYTKLDTFEEPSVLINLNDDGTYNDDNNNEVFLNPKHNKQQNSAATANSKSFSFFHLNGPVSVRQVKLVVIPFGIRLLLTGLIWDHYVNNYQMLLQNYTDNLVHRATQLKIFKSIGMWLVMWFWRLANGCAIFEHLVFATFFDKVWDYLVVTSFIGWVYLISLTIFTQLHYSEVTDTLIRTVALSS